MTSAVCQGTAHALALLRERPDIAFGIHLTLVRDRPEDAWRPLTAGPSLVDDDGLLPLHAHAAGVPARTADVVAEFRAQIDVSTKADRYAALLRGLPPGLSEWAVHPGSDPGAAHDATVRRGDLAFLTSDRARRIVEEEGVALIDYRPVRRCRRASSG